MQVLKNIDYIKYLKDDSNYVEILKNFIYEFVLFM